MVNPRLSEPVGWGLESHRGCFAGWPGCFVVPFLVVRQAPASRRRSKPGMWQSHRHLRPSVDRDPAFVGIGLLTILTSVPLGRIEPAHTRDRVG
jgi:hypothetical protein